MSVCRGHELANALYICCIFLTINEFPHPRVFWYSAHTFFFRPLTVSITCNHLHLCFMLNKRKHLWELKCVFNLLCSLPQTRVKVRNEDRTFFCKIWYWIGEGFEPDVLHQSDSGRVNCYRRVAQWWGVQIGGHKKLTLFVIPFLSSLVPVKNKFVTTITIAVYLK